jgi:urease subunit alpha
VAVCLHTDGLNESCELEETVQAIGGRAVHAYHVEGVGGGHVPDLIGIVRVPNVVCSSTTPTIPYGRATAAEHLEMILMVHGGSADVPEDVAAARERIHPATMAAEGPLHDLGAISIMNSDSQGMGRIGETIRRTWQLAHTMKLWRETALGAGWPDAPGLRDGSVGRVEDSRPDDNERVLRYLAKYTAEPARVHGIEREVGSLRPGRLADIVLWRPSHFGVRPELVLKNGWFAWGSCRRRQRVSRGSRAPPVRPALGGAGDGSRRALYDLRLGRGARERHRPAPREPATVRRGWRHSLRATRDARGEHRQSSGRGGTR